MTQFRAAAAVATKRPGLACSACLPARSSQLATCNLPLDEDRLVVQANCSTDSLAPVVGVGVFCGMHAKKVVFISFQRTTHTRHSCIHTHTHTHFIHTRQSKSYLRCFVFCARFSGVTLVDLMLAAQSKPKYEQIYVCISGRSLI